MEAELAEVSASGSASTNPLLLRMNPLDYMVYILRNIRSSDLEQALLVLPFHCVVRLIKLLAALCQRGTDVELIAKSCLFLFRAHQARIMSTCSLSREVSLLSEKLRENIACCRRLVGTNMAALRFANKQIGDEKNDKYAFREDIMKIDTKKTAKQGKGKRNIEAGPRASKKSKL